MLKTKLCGVRLKNPLMLAAGVLGSHASSLNWILKILSFKSVQNCVSSDFKNDTFFLHYLKKKYKYLFLVELLAFDLLQIIHLFY